MSEADNRFRIFCDASVCDQEKRAGCAALIQSPDGQIVDAAMRPLEHMHVHIAEFEALIEGLRLAGRHEAQAVVLFTDSLPVQNGLFKGKKLKNKAAEERAHKFRSMAGGFDCVQVFWIPREENSLVDGMANVARKHRQFRPLQGRTVEAALAI